MTDITKAFAVTAQPPHACSVLDTLLSAVHTPPPVLCAISGSRRLISSQRHLRPHSWPVFGCRLLQVSLQVTTDQLHVLADRFSSCAPSDDVPVLRLVLTLVVFAAVLFPCLSADTDHLTPAPSITMPAHESVRALAMPQCV